MVFFTAFEIASPKTLLVDSKYWGSQRREGRGTLCWVAGARHGLVISGVSKEDQNDRYPRYTFLKQSQHSISLSFLIK
jgi:hypothetical protein